MSGESPQVSRQASHSGTSVWPATSHSGRTNTPLPRWKRVIAILLIGLAAVSVSGCGIEFDFPEVELGGPQTRENPRQM